MAKTPPEDPNDLVLITNPKLPPATPGTVSREAFDSLYADKGWQIEAVQSFARAGEEEAAAEQQAAAEAAIADAKTAEKGATK